MLSRELRELTVPAARTMVIIWGAMMAASVVYLIIAWIFTRENTGIAENSINPGFLQAALGVAALGAALGSVFAERFAFSEVRILQNLRQTPHVDRLNKQSSQHQKPISAEQVARFEALSATDQRLACSLPYYQTTMIIVWALRESIALMGLVLTLLLGQFLFAVPFVVAAVAMIAIKPPRAGAFLEENRSRAQGIG